MTTTTAPQPLSRDSLGHLAYLHRVLTGSAAPPVNSAAHKGNPAGFRIPHSAFDWSGFYKPQADAMNFGLRFQLAFAAYAVAALGQRTPAYTRPYIAALGAAIERMLDVQAWGYWRRPAGTPDAAPAGHVALLLTPHGHA